MLLLATQNWRTQPADRQLLPVPARRPWLARFLFALRFGIGNVSPVGHVTYDEGPDVLTVEDDTAGAGRDGLGGGRSAGRDLA